MPYEHGKFSGAGKSSGMVPKPPQNEKENDNPPQRSVKSGAPEAPHGDSQEKHVTATHPGKTQPHPATGVHAFYAHHTGEGRYTSHTHGDGGDVQSREHPSHADMMAAMNEALPDDGDANQGTDPRNGQVDFSQELRGVGGDKPNTGY